MGFSVHFPQPPPLDPPRLPQPNMREADPGARGHHLESDGPRGRALREEAGAAAGGHRGNGFAQLRSRVAPARDAARVFVRFGTAFVFLLIFCFLLSSGAGFEDCAKRLLVGVGEDVSLASFFGVWYFFVLVQTCGEV